MKRIALIITCFIFAYTSYAQTIKIDNGISTNSIKGERIDLFPNQIPSYSVLLGIEYFEKRWIYLSSEIGYIKLGGQEDGTLNGVPLKYKQTWDYVHLNTSARLRATTSKTEFYLGAGPYLNVLPGSGDFHDSFYDGYSTQRINWGCKTEIGINGIINRFKSGLNCTYLLPFSPVFKSPYTSMNARSITVYFSIGYRLK